MVARGISHPVVKQGDCWEVRNTAGVYIQRRDGDTPWLRACERRSNFLYDCDRRSGRAMLYNFLAQQLMQG